MVGSYYMAVCHNEETGTTASNVCVKIPRPWNRVRYFMWMVCILVKLSGKSLLLVVCLVIQQID